MELRPGKPALTPAVAVPTVAAAGKRGMRLRPYNTRHGLLRQPDPLPQAQAPVRGERLSHALPPVLLAARPRGLYAKFVCAAAKSIRGGALSLFGQAQPFHAAGKPAGEQIVPIQRQAQIAKFLLLRGELRAIARG